MPSSGGGRREMNAKLIGLVRRSYANQRGMGDLAFVGKAVLVVAVV